MTDRPTEADDAPTDSYVDISEYPEPPFENFVPLPPTEADDHADTVEWLNLKARIRELEAEVARLEARGITDMQHRIAELEAANEDKLATIRQYHREAVTARAEVARLTRQVDHAADRIVKAEAEVARLTALGDALADALSTSTMFTPLGQTTRAAAIDAWGNR